MTSPSEFTCRFCDAPWDDTRKRFEHAPDCPITTGFFPTLRRKKKSPRVVQDVKPLGSSLDLEEEP